MHKPKGGNMPNDDKTKDDVKNDDIVDDDVNKDVIDDITSDDTSDKDDVLSEKEKKAISESRKYQNRAQKAEKALKKIQDEKLSENEKKDLKLKEEKDRADTAEAKLKNSDLDSMILGYASTLGFQDLDVVKLIARKELANEEEISEEDVKSVIDLIAKEKKYLLGESGTTDVGKGNFEGGKKIKGDETIDDRFRKALQQGRTRNII